MEFNPLHPAHILRERGWKEEPNPFLPKPRRSIRSYTDKHIFIYANQLWYDIDTTTRLIGRSRMNVKDVQGEDVPTSENDQERPMFYRWFDKYIKKVEGMLTAYVMKPEGKVRDNALKEWDEKEIWLKMPDYWDDTRYDSLVQAIHTYISTGALLEYLMLTLTSKDPVTQDKATQLQDAELDILDAANSVMAGSIDKPLRPF